MPRPLLVHFLPELTTPEELAGGDVVVIDVLRASTTITHALAAGAREVIPCLEIDDARAVASKFASGQVVLGGERKGLPIEGFDLGNSPRDYRPDRVSSKTVVFTTTNGTKAMMRCREAARVLIGSFVNLSAVAQTLMSEQAPIHLVCAGTAGKITGEDVALAGSLVFVLMRANDGQYQLNDQARIARELGRQILGGSLIQGDRNLASGIAKQMLRDSQGGRNLTAIGLDRDIEQAAEVDHFDFVPALDLVEWKIVA